MKAIIMAGGEGRRLRPMTFNLPKPMVPVMGRPVMEHAVNLLKRHGIRDIAATLAFKPDIIKAHFANELVYFIEEEPLGTAGSIKNCAPFIDGTFVVISGDALTDFDISAAIDFHRSKNALATLVIKEVETTKGFGLTESAPDGRITGFKEKPQFEDVTTDTVNTGIYILEQEILKHIPTGKYDFGSQLFPKLLKEGAPLYSYSADGYWCDIGGVRQYLNAHADMFAGRCKITLFNTVDDNGIWRPGEGSVETEKGGKFYIGEGALVKPGAVVREGSAIGAGCVLEENSSVSRGVVWSGAIIGRGSRVSGGVVCENAVIGKNVQVFEEAVIGKGSVLSDRITIFPGARVGASKRMDASVDSNIMWGFGESGIPVTWDGAELVKFTPTEAAALGNAVAALRKGKVIAAYDGDGAALAMALAAASGAAAAGVDCYTALADTHAAAYLIASTGAGYAMCFSNSTKMATLIDGQGSRPEYADIKKIQSHIDECEYTRSSYAAIRRIDGYMPLYMRWMLGAARPVIAERRPKIAVSCPVQFTLDTAVRILLEAGAHANGVESVRLKAPLKGYDAMLALSENGYYILAGSEEYAGIRAEAFLNLCLIESGARSIYSSLPLMPFFETEAAGRAKVYEKRPDGRHDKNDVFMHAYSNPAVAALVIANAVANPGFSEAAADSMPPVYEASQVVDCAENDIGRVMKRLLSESAEESGVIIRPEKDGRGIGVRAYSASEEFAEAAAFDAAEMVRELIRRERNLSR
ncbi:MAG: sugar phosphate nucleotidyltransferase [Christensenellales bacterium]